MSPKVYYVEKIGLGFLAIMAKPMSGEWIEDEFSGLANLQVLQILSLLELSEQNKLGLKDEKILCEKNNIKFISYPIKDRGLPSSVQEFAQLTKVIHKQIIGGANTVIHCRAGIGRTGIVAAGVLLHAELGATEAFQRISKARGIQVPDTEQQFDWVVANQNEIIS
ncbi:MAG: dual specificity protein phosphatase family protein [Methylococcales bacterium]